MVLFDGTVPAPIEMYREWFELASASEPNDANAAALATSTPDGRPSVRMVLVKSAEEEGLRFFTNRDSRKGVELMDNPQAALCLHWKSLRRQVRFEGHVHELPRADVEAYFHSRSRGSQIAASISHQSHPVPSRQALDGAAHARAAALEGKQVPVPDFWTGYLLAPHRIEFWSDGADRLHDRLLFTLVDGHWRHERLYP